MFVVVTGGSGSGKSEFAENLLLELDRSDPSAEKKERYYIATMIPFGEESRKRIRRHREMRKEKGFSTIECYTDLSGVKFPGTGEMPSVLLECMSNLVANEYYGEDGAGENAEEAILSGIEQLLGRTRHLVVVTNEVFSDGVSYDDSTKRYQRILSSVNAAMAGRADAFVEVVYTIPVYHKGEPL